MKTATSLSSQQKKAKEVYELYQTNFMMALWLAAGSVSLILIVIQVLVVKEISRLNPSLGQPSRHFYFGAAGMIIAYTVGHYCASRWVRYPQSFTKLQNVEVESIELVAKGVPAFGGETAQWRQPKTKKAITVYFVLTIIFLFVLIFYGWKWHNPQSAWDEQADGAIGFFIYTLMAVLLVIFSTFPVLQIDEKGILSFRTSWWPRRLPWNEIASCKITRVKNHLSEEEMRWFTFLDEQEKVLLTLDTAALRGLNESDLDEIETEVRRRLNGNESATGNH